MTNYKDILALLRDGVSADALAADFSKKLNEAERELKEEREAEQKAAMEQDKLNDMNAIMTTLDNYIVDYAPDLDLFISAIEVEEIIEFFDTAKIVNHGNGTISYLFNFWGADIVFTIGKGSKSISIGTTSTHKTDPSIVKSEKIVSTIDTAQLDKAFADAKKTVSNIFGMKESDVDRILNDFIKDIDFGTINTKNGGCKKK